MIRADTSTLQKQQVSPEILSRNVASCLYGPDEWRLVRKIILINLLILLVRPQHSIPVLGVLFMPLILSLIPLPFWLTKVTQNWTRHMKLMFAFVVFGALWVPFATNNHWAFHTWRDIAQQFICFFFPMIAFLSYGRHLRTMALLIVFIAVYLSIYGMTHVGTGPGSFLKDENDLCLALVVFLPVPVFLLYSRRSYLFKAAMVVSILLILGGIVVTESRGGFVGLVAVAFYLFYRSRRKLTILCLVAIVAVSAYCFVPQSYWKEMSTIKDTGGGTAKARMDTWKLAVKAWSDPKNTLAGVGMGNARWVIGHYELAHARTEEGRSFAGRAMHSLYMELLLDLGVLGVILFASIVWVSFRGNSRNQLKLNNYFKRLNSVGYYLAKKYRDVGVVPGGKEEVRLEFEPSPNDLSMEIRKKLERSCGETMRYIAEAGEMLSALNAGWIGVLSAGAFISVLYYPPLWLLAALSATFHLYIARLSHSLEPFLDCVENSQLGNETA